MIDLSQASLDQPHPRASSKAEAARNAHHAFAVELQAITSADGGEGTFSGGPAHILLPPIAPAQKADTFSDLATSKLPKPLAALSGSVPMPVLQLAAEVRRRQDRENAGRPIAISVRELATALDIQVADAGALLDVALRRGVVVRNSDALGNSKLHVPLPGNR